MPAGKRRPAAQLCAQRPFFGFRFLHVSIGKRVIFRVNKGSAGSKKSFLRKSARRPFMTGQSAFLLGNTPRTPIHSVSLHFRVGLKISIFDLKSPIVKRAGNFPDFAYCKTCRLAKGVPRRNYALNALFLAFVFCMYPLEKGSFSE